MAKNAMRHSFVLLTKGRNVAEFSRATINTKETEYIPVTSVIAHTKLIEGGIDQQISPVIRRSAHKE